MKIMCIVFMISIFTVVTACSTIVNDNSDSGNVETPNAIYKLFGVINEFTGVAKFLDLGRGLPGFGNWQRSRIPTIYTLDDGSILAGGDARRPHNGDSPNNIDSWLRKSTDNGNTWSSKVIFPHIWLDYDTNNIGGNERLSASFIDSSMAQAQNGDVVLMINSFIGGGGIQGGISRPAASPFFDLDGKRYLLLVNKNDSSPPTDTSTADDMGLFTNVVLLGEITLNGVEPTKAKLIFDDSVNRRSIIKGLNADMTIGDPIIFDGSSNWEIDEYWRVYKDGQAYMINSRSGSSTPPKVHAVTLFQESPFRAVNNTYAMINISSDRGETWYKGSRDVSWNFRTSSGEGIVGPLLGQTAPAHSDAERARQHYIVSPGRMFVATEGSYEGRMFSSLYDHGAGGERPLFVFSDDDGRTWQRGGEANNLRVGSRASETQIFEAPDGSAVLAVSRTGGGIGISESLNGGDTWSPIIATGLYDGSANGTMISVINLRRTVGVIGQDLVAFSFPDRTSRNNGAVHITEIKKGEDGRWNVFYNYPNTLITDMKINVGMNKEDAWNKSFGYSVITELTNGNIGLLSEGFDSTVFEYYEIELNRKGIQ